MLRRIPKGVLAGAAIVGGLALVYVARSMPGFLTNQTILGGLILLELIVAAVWNYRRVFFLLLIMAFLLAGTGLPGSAVWTVARWLFLGVGAVVGLLMVLKGRQRQFGLFHAIALFAILAATVSAAVSRYPTSALLKASSLFLLFLYAASGARLAVVGRETRFVAGLVVGCEILVTVLAVLYLAFGANLLGNPNSLGAIMGAVAAPVLLWGALAAKDAFARRRRLFMFALCLYLLFHSHARAGMIAAAFSCGLLCIGLRRYRFLIAGVAITTVLLSTLALVQPKEFFESASSVTSDVVYKGLRESGVLASRESPWKLAVDSIRTHFWFGTGFGTPDKRTRVSQRFSTLSLNSQVTSEFGSSYLAITTWVGMMGVLPFFALLVVLSGKVLRTVAWMLRTGDASHPAIPLAMIVVAGMLHAIFEDWMFAPGYYLCVFFWCMAFVLVDLAPLRATQPAPRDLKWYSRQSAGALDAVAPTR